MEQIRVIPNNVSRAVLMAAVRADDRKPRPSEDLTRPQDCRSPFYTLEPCSVKMDAYTYDSHR